MTINASLLAVLTSSERQLVAKTEPGELNVLDEDGAVKLHDRILKARNKYSGEYRRMSGSRTSPARGNGKARMDKARTAKTSSHQGNSGMDDQRPAMKTEAFEEALSRVSRRVAALARKSAADLRAERIHAARSTRKTSRPAKKASASRPRAASTTRRSSASNRPTANSPKASSAHTRRMSTRKTAARRPTRQTSR